jgi:hypothetical protein
MRAERTTGLFLVMGDARLLSQGCVESLTASGVRGMVGLTRFAVRNLPDGSRPVGVVVSGA